MENEKKYVCPFCGRDNFKNKSGLTQHIKNCKQNPNRVDSHMQGRKLSDETKRKISESGKIAQNKPEVKQKISEASKRMWENPEYREKQNIIQKEIHNRQEVKQKISKASKQHWQNPEYIEKQNTIQKLLWENPEYRIKKSNILKTTQNNPEVKQKISKASKQHWQNPEYIEKRYNTLKQNNSFNSSKIETELKNYFDSNNIYYITQYKNNLYPFCCDFYFPDKDLYVEIQGSWTHGGKPYIETDQDCISQLEIWKSKNTKFYNNAINTWTVRDVNKRNIAKQNNLNWIEIFSNDLDECVNIILNYL